MTGLALLLIGAVAAASAGFPIGELITGDPVNRAGLLYIVVASGGGVVLAVVGNYLWYRAKVAKRPAPSQS
jgi:putative flippase GtrA